jgi:hypothetical protein
MQDKSYAHVANKGGGKNKGGRIPSILNPKKALLMFSGAFLMAT